VPKKTRKPKHVPQRTCVGCREIQPKRTMIRIVRTQNAVVIDLTGKLSGRGAYLHNLRTCWEKGLKGSLAQALKTELTGQDRELLISFMETLDDEVLTPAGINELS
jgi:predicted RNA-binding protein YlxR (DUF448 family)